MTAIIKPRVQSIDLLRGAVMIIMALDHSRDYFHYDAIAGNDPLDFNTTSAIVFMTRWITHYCAPVFVFLAGTSIFFMSQSKTPKQLSLFLFTRGLWLMLMELTIVTIGWDFSLSFPFLGLQVIWVIGLSMIVMALLTRLPQKLLLVLSLLLVFGHNALDSFSKVTDSATGVAVSVLHVPHIFLLGAHHKVYVLYTLVPWVGVMALGYLFGNLYKSGFDVLKRKKILLSLGLACIFLFVLLRSGNFYGDASHWEHQSNPVFTLLSFINTSKYPPSLLYLLMTLGPGFLFLAFAENIRRPTNSLREEPPRRNRLADAVIIYGRVPFFYYLLHIYLIHAIAGILFLATGHHLSELNPEQFAGGLPKGFGFHLWEVYLLWLLVVGLLYYPCKWYNNYKSTHSYWWLSYL